MKTKPFFPVLLYAALATTLLTVGVFTFLRPIFTLRIPSSGALTITASGMKNPASAGCEVRTRQILLDGGPEDLAMLATTPGWSMDGDLLVAYNVSSPVTLNIPVERVVTLTLATVEQRGSGYLDLTLEDFQQTLDLCADSDWEETEQQFLMGIEKFAPHLRPDLLLELWVIVLIFLKLICLWMKRYNSEILVAEL